MSNHDIAVRFAEEAGKPNPRLLLARSGNVYVNPYDHRELLSWGSHFVLARIMLDSNGNRAWWLLNGDRYSHSTSQHQSDIRSAVQKTGLPVIILPFSALHEAKIIPDTIQLREVQDDRWEDVWRIAASYDDIPPWRDKQERPDGRWEYAVPEHHLGESVFRAAYRTGWAAGKYEGEWVEASFLSAFDTQETRPLYFLAQVPGNPKTVAAAREALKPRAVKNADKTGTAYVRQGDVFAVETGLTTRELTRGGKLPIVKRAQVLGVSHTISEVITVGGKTYGRGIMRHDPGRWRTPEHKRVKLGNGKTWHLIVKNTVPPDRSWSIAGNVD
jgi:hypothetical protein